MPRENVLSRAVNIDDDTKIRVVDNVTGESRTIDKKDTYQPAYGAIGGSDLTPITVSPGTPVKIIGLSNSATSKKVTQDGTNGTLTATISGDYRINYDISFSVSGNATFEIGFYVDGVKTPLTGGAKAQGSQLSFSEHYSTNPFNLPLGTETIDLRIETDTERDYTINSILINLYKLD